MKKERTDTVQELTECLVIQREIDAKTIELRKRYKAVLEAERARGNNQTIVVQIEGNMYAIKRVDYAEKLEREALEQVHELRGFYLYRLFKIGRVVE